MESLRPSFLGMHQNKSSSLASRGHEAFIQVKGRPFALDKVGDKGLFEAILPAGLQPRDYKVWHIDGMLDYDPYSFLPSLGDIDEYLFMLKGFTTNFIMCLAVVLQHTKLMRLSFLSGPLEPSQSLLLADFNHWDGRANPMPVPLGKSGIWEIFVPGLKNTSNTNSKSKRRAAK